MSPYLELELPTPSASYARKLEKATCLCAVMSSSRLGFKGPRILESRQEGGVFLTYLFLVGNALRALRAAYGSKAPVDGPNDIRSVHVGMLLTAQT